MMTSRVFLTAGISAVLLAGCGGGSGPTGPGPGGGNTTGAMTAKVDGQSWSSPSSVTAVATVASAPGLYVISGLQSSGGTAQAITLSLLGIPGPGTYPLGVGSGVAGGTGIFAQASSGWATPLSGTAGTIALTTLTSTRIAGTFSFNADPTTGPASGVKVITNGTFDLPITTAVSSGTVANNLLNKITATIGGTPYNAASVATQSTPAQIFGFASTTNTRGLSLSISGGVAPGTYPIGTQGAVTTVIGVSSECTPGGPMACTWSSALGGATGSVTITSIAGNRATGTFSGTLPRLAGTGATTLTIANGTFDIGW